MRKIAFVSVWVTVAVVGLAFSIYVYLFGRVMRDWGVPQVYMHDAARPWIRNFGFSPGPDATNLYFYVDGFQDHTVFIAFSDLREILDSIVYEKTGKKPGELEKWYGKAVWEDEDWNPNPNLFPGSSEKKYRTAFYDISGITNGGFFREWKGDERWHLIYDREHARLYYKLDSGSYLEREEQREPPRPAEPSSAGASEGR